ncbi:hypothetical protein AGMMS49525_10880 [Bacteroidia bacterium]|nr:hypothetical protein AGMMS49525_10880 [Bacteroidia bacterium]
MQADWNSGAALAGLYLLGGWDEWDFAGSWWSSTAEGGFGVMNGSTSVMGLNSTPGSSYIQSIRCVSSL